MSIKNRKKKPIIFKEETRGRKRHEVDWSVVDTALYYGATLEQVQYLLENKGIKLNTQTIQDIIEREKGVNFSSYRDYCRRGLRYKLSQKAVEMAMKENASLMIFCLKNICGWADQPKHEQEKDHTQTELNLKLLSADEVVTLKSLLQKAQVPLKKPNEA